LIFFRFQFDVVLVHRVKHKHTHTISIYYLRISILLSLFLFLFSYKIIKFLRKEDLTIIQTIRLPLFCEIIFRSNLLMSMSIQT